MMRTQNRRKPMTRHFRIHALLLVVLVTASTGLWSQARRPVASATSKMAEASVRDLAPARAESVGMSTERLKRLDAAMKRLVDDTQVAGLVTLVERHGKIVHFNAVGQSHVPKMEHVE